MLGATADRTTTAVFRRSMLMSGEANGRIYPLLPPLLEQTGPFVQAASSTDLEDDVKLGHNATVSEANLEVSAVLWTYALVLQQISSVTKLFIVLLLQSPLTTAEGGDL